MVRGGFLMPFVDPQPQPPSFPAYFLYEKLPHTHQEDGADFTLLRKTGKEKLLLEALDAVMPSISNIELLAPGGIPLLWATLSDGIMLPVPLLGDGGMRLLRIVLKIGRTANGVVFIDEVGHGIHYSILDTMWRVINKASEAFNTQVIATTHSFEAIAAAHRAFSEKDQYKRFQYLRLDKIRGKIRPVFLDQQQLELAIASGFEVR